MTTHVTRRDAGLAKLARRFGICAAGVIGTLLMLAPASALATSVRMAGTTLSYVASDGQTNIVTVEVDAGGLVVSDDGVSTIDDDDGDGGCSVDGNKAFCPMASSISIDTGDRSDHLEIGGLPPHTVLIPGPGTDEVFGGDGNDEVRARDGEVDNITCGGGDDSVVGDQVDQVNGCENVDDEPNTVITSGPPEFSNSTSASFQFSATDNPTFVCKLDGTTVTCPPADFGGLEVGSHAFEVTATDEFGNVETTPAVRSWTVDLTSPDTAITSGPGTTINTASATFTFESADPDGAGFECSLDSSDWIPCASPTTYSNLPNGAHTVSVRTVDRAGNRDPSPATSAFTVSVPAGAFSKTPAGNLVLIAGKAVKISKRGYATVALNCAGARNCAGRVILATSKPIRYSAVRRRRIVRLGSAKFSIPATRTRRVRIRISKPKVRLVRKLRRVPADVIVRDLDRSGRARVSTRTIVLKAPK
jgi:hypothetical protein